MEGFLRSKIQTQASNFGRWASHLAGQLGTGADMHAQQSGAIIDYLLDTYDKEGKLHFLDFPKKYEQRSWEHFQMSKLCPDMPPILDTIGWLRLQAVRDLTSASLHGFLSYDHPPAGYDESWPAISQFHPEKNITSAIDRYANEIKRVLGVIELHLTKTGNEYLMGDKACYADLMFVTWNHFAPNIVKDWSWKEALPKSYEWHQKLEARPAVQKVFADQKKAKGE
jgi:glutathione S-transferase